MDVLKSRKPFYLFFVLLAVFVGILVAVCFIFGKDILSKWEYVNDKDKSTEESTGTYSVFGNLIDNQSKNENFEGMAKFKSMSREDLLNYFYETYKEKEIDADSFKSLCVFRSLSRDDRKITVNCGGDEISSYYIAAPFLLLCEIPNSKVTSERFYEDIKNENDIPRLEKLYSYTLANLYGNDDRKLNVIQNHLEDYKFSFRVKGGNNSSMGSFNETDLIYLYTEDTFVCNF